MTTPLSTTTPTESALDYSPCPDERCNDQLGPFPIPQCVTAVAWAEEADRVASVLRQLSDQFNSIDNGRCTVCRVGHRLWKVPGKVKGPCDYEQCLSHRISEILERYELPSKATLERIRQNCLDVLQPECHCGTTKDAYGCRNGH